MITGKSVVVSQVTKQFPGLIFRHGPAKPARKDRDGIGKQLFRELVPARASRLIEVEPPLFCRAGGSCFAPTAGTRNASM